MVTELTDMWLRNFDVCASPEEKERKQAEMRAYLAALDEALNPPDEVGGTNSDRLDGGSGLNSDHINMSLDSSSKKPQVGASANTGKKTQSERRGGNQFQSDEAKRLQEEAEKAAQTGKEGKTPQQVLDEIKAHPLTQFFLKQTGLAFPTVQMNKLLSEPLNVVNPKTERRETIPAA